MPVLLGLSVLLIVAASAAMCGYSAYSRDITRDIQMNISIGALALALLLLPFPAMAADQDGSTQNQNKSSTVDTTGKKAAAPGSHPASPGTVGAMSNDGSGSFTASKADQKKNPLK